jgi:hypothetical protein
LRSFARSNLKSNTLLKLRSQLNVHTRSGLLARE